MMNGVELRHECDVDCLRRGVAHGNVRNYWKELAGRRHADVGATLIRGTDKMRTNELRQSHDYR